MGSAPGYIEKVILGKERGLFSYLIRILLWPFAFIYVLGLTFYLGLYKIGIKKQHRLPVPVISVGNITFGGTGKTPAVQTICRLLFEKGKKVVVLSRGHGGKAKGSVVVSNENAILVDVSASGDEPLLLAKSLSGVPIIVGKDRRESGNLACKLFNPDVIVLDDGMQYWQLYRDLDITILDARRPYGSGLLMPMGDLREPISGLKRSSILLLSNYKGLDDKSRNKLLFNVKAIVPNVEVFECSHEPLFLRRVSDGNIFSLEWLRNKNVIAFCGIAKPWFFFTMLESLEAIVKKSIIFPDHHLFVDEDIQMIIHEYRRFDADIIITTEKDAVRIEPSLINNLYALAIQLEVEDFPRFAEYIEKII